MMKSMVVMLAVWSGINCACVFAGQDAHHKPPMNDPVRVLNPGSQDLQATSPGPHGGVMHFVEETVIEPIVGHGGIVVYFFDQARRSIDVSSARGVATLKVTGGAKRYRFDLLPEAARRHRVSD